MKQMGDDAAEGGPRRIGEDLAAARTSRGFELQDIAERTRVPLRHLVAIEGGDYMALPSPTYSIGFVRAYARELGLDEVASAARFRAEVGRTERPVQQVSMLEPANPARVPTRPLAWVALTIAILLAIGYGVWRSGIVTGDTAEERQRLAAGMDDQQAAPDSPDAPQAKAASGTPVAQGPVTLTPAEPVWIKVYERGGATLFMGEVTPGKAYVVPATAKDPLLITGRPQSLKVTVGNRAVPPLGDGSRTVTDVSLQAAALLGTNQPTPTSAPAAATP